MDKFFFPVPQHSSNHMLTAPGVWPDCRLKKTNILLGQTIESRWKKTRRSDRVQCSRLHKQYSGFDFLFLCLVTAQTVVSFFFLVRCSLTLRDLPLNRRLGVPQSWSGHRGAQRYFLLLSGIYPQFRSHSACSSVCITDEISCMRFWHLLRAKAGSPLKWHKKKHSLLMMHFIRDAGEVLCSRL